MKKMSVIVATVASLGIAFHSYYNKARVITENSELSRARLYLVVAARTVVKNALGLLGVNAPKKM